jgi:hypothetical protein
MLEKWLECADRAASPYTKFAVIDINEQHEVTDEIKENLRRMLRDALFGNELLEDAAAELGWDWVDENIIREKAPTLMQIQRGHFGEALMAEILREFYGYEVPVAKLRYAFLQNQSPPLTDVIALKLDDSGKITEVCFAEAKLRSTSSTDAGTKAYESLKFDYEKKLSEVTTFMLGRLHEQDEALFKAFLRYLREREDTVEKDSFCIALVFNSASWSDTVLENLEDSGVDLPRITVEVVRIADIADLCDGLFADLGFVGVFDDE